ncbi:MAG: hypothetical protein ACYDBQ_11070 [Thermoplasmatota archaeon]
MRWLPVALLLVAGCAAPPTPVPMATVAHEAPRAPAPPRVQILIWTGEIPYGAWACSPQVPRGCQAQPATAYGVNFTAPVAGRTRGGNLTLTWTAASALTQTMSLGAQVDGCTCNRSLFGADVNGVSPLQLAVPGGVVLSPGTILKVWVYGGPYEAEGATAVGASGDQPFRVDGTVVVEG